jgi:hypothetical protein
VADRFAMLVLGLLQGHGLHVVVFGVPTVVLLTVTIWQELRGRTRHRASQTSPRAHRAARSTPVFVAAGSLVTAAAVHAVVAPEHFHEYLWFGVFFTVLTVCQVGVAIKIVVQPDRATLLTVGVTSLAVVALWVAARTSGVPIGPEPWRPEAIGALDVLASAAELVATLACALALWSQRSAPVRRAGTKMAGALQ